MMNNTTTTETSPAYLTMADKTALIRAELKKMGITSRKVSVRTPHHGSIRVEIRDLAIKIAAVEKIARAFEHVRHCELTGEILSGGNTFVDVSYSDEALTDAVAAILPEVEALASDGRTGHIGPFNVWKDGEYVCFELPSDDTVRHARCWGTRFAAERLAIAIANLEATPNT